MSDDSMSAPASLPSGMHPDEPQFTRRYGWPTAAWQRLVQPSRHSYAPQSLTVTSAPSFCLGLQTEIACRPAAQV